MFWIKHLESEVCDLYPAYVKGFDFEFSDGSLVSSVSFKSADQRVVCTQYDWTSRDSDKIPVPEQFLSLRAVRFDAYRACDDFMNSAHGVGE